MMRIESRAFTPGELEIISAANGEMYQLKKRLRKLIADWRADNKFIKAANDLEEILDDKESE